MKTHAVAGRPRGQRSTAVRARAARPAHDAHERQAERSAARFVRGESGLGAALTPAATASWHLPSSVPGTLPVGLRASLELAFDADLGGLRVHTDAPAQWAARQLGARAFTAGAALYFGPGAWAPSTPIGRELIAHEVAHALQQAARPAHRGRRRLEPGAHGDAAVQREPDPNDLIRESRDKLAGGTAVEGRFSSLNLLQPGVDGASCIAAIDRHLGSSTDATVRKYADRIKKDVDGKSLEDAIDAVDAVLSAAPAADMTDAVKALFFDAYKSLNADVAAAGVVGKQLPERTAFGSWSFYASQRRGDASWVTKLLKKHPVAGKYFPNAIVHVARLDFYGATRGGLNLDPEMKFNETMADAIVEALLYQPLMPDERTAVALRAFCAFDTVRLEPFRLMKKTLKDNKSLMARFVVKKFFIDNYTDPAYLVRLAESLSAEPEVIQIATEVGALIAPIAVRAKRFWESVQAMGLAVGTTRGQDAAAQMQSAKLQEAVRTRLPTLKPLAGVQKKLIAVLARATRLDHGALPKPASMAGHFGAAAKMIEQLTYQVDSDLAARDKKLQVKEIPPPAAVDVDPAAEADETPADVTDDMVYGVVLFLLFALHGHLVSYAAPPKTKDTAQGIRDSDAAAHAFHELVYVFFNASNILGYDSLRDSASVSLRARQEGLLKSHVGLLAPFEKTHSSLKEFSDNFPTGELTGGAIQGAALVQMVYALYYENLLVKLNAVLTAKTPAGPTREFSYEAGQEPIVNTALKGVESSLQLPRRYRVPLESTVLYVRPADRTQVADLLPGNHPVLQELVSKELGPDENGYIPQNISAHKEGFVVWFLPDMARLVDKLAQVPGIQQLPLPGGKLLGAPKDYALPRDWLSALNLAAGQDKKVRADLAGAIETWMKGALSDLDAPLRRATNNERHIVRPMIEKQWERLEKSFLKAPEAYYEAPRRALELTMIFAGNIQPARPEEQQLQMTGLMLELAPVLARKLGETTTFGSLVTVSGTDRLDIVLPLFAHVKGAAKLASDSANEEALKSLWLIFEMSDLKRRAGQLNALAQAFKATAEKAQEDVVLEGLPGENMLRVPNRGYPIVGRKHDDDDVTDTFMVEGVVYTLIKVHRAFTYQPELLTRGSAVAWDENDLGQRRLWVDGEEVKADAPAVELVTIMRTPSGGSPVEIVVRSDKTSMLTELTYAVHMHIVLEQLSDLAGVLEGFASVLTTALQIAFPEVAAPIAYAELAGSVLRFLGSAEYAMLRGALDSDSGSLFDSGLSELKKQLTLEVLWDYLLFDTVPPMFETLSAAMTPQGRMGMFRSKGGDSTKKASRKVIGRLVRAGAELVKGAEVMHEHVTFSVRKTALFVEGSPWVAVLLRAVASNLHRLQGLDLKELGVDKAADMVGSVQEMYRRFEGVLDALGSYELPDELVPLEAIVEMAVNLLIDKLPLKYRVPLQGSRHIGAVEEIFQWLFGKVADQLRSARLDPNIIWRDHARTALEPYLKKAGTAVSDEVHGLLTQVPFLKDLAAMDVREITMQFADRDAPESAQPRLADGAGLPAGSPRLPGGPGARLDAPSQARARRGFGHDFSHVRLHRGPAVDAGLRQSGALAATSGSHVYLDSGLRTDGAQGGDVLNHELAHVLQQTGPRPLGARHASDPVRGERGGARGWRIDTAAESQADALAQAAREPARSPRNATRSEGLQPKLTDTIAKFFQKLGDPTKLQESAAETLKEKVDPAAMSQALPQLQANFAAKLVEALKTVGKPGSPVAFAGPFGVAAQDLVDYVVKNRKTDLDTGMPHVLMSGLQQIQRRKDKGTKSATTETFWIVNLGRTETALEEFFFGVTGVSMDVELNTKKEQGPDGKDRKTIDPDQPFKRLKFNYLHLPMIGGTAKLWSDIMTNSFPKVTADKLPFYQAKARLALQGLQPGPAIYTSATRAGAKVLVFAKRAKDLMDTYINPPPSRDLPGDAAPKWSEYILPDPQSRVKIGTVDYGQIGLRLGLYKDKGNADQQKGTDRASHHTVQYLLLEYFVNSKDKHKPFPNPLSLYPNVKGTGNRVDVIATKPDGDAGILVSSNEAGRGGEMPTILLSVHAHTLGDVHVSPKADDLDVKAPSQGAAIHGIYRDALGEFADLVLGKAPPLQAIANKRLGKPFKEADLPKLSGKEVTPEDLSSAIFTATCKTYTWMRNLMNDKLAAAIDSREVEYYEALVKTAKNASIYAGDQPQAGYVPSKVGQSIKADVLSKQVAVLQSASFGFKEAS
ncbi:hypothetical protein BURC_03763 [Burkholderiaceae bacterium]|nr:hypothetical protein BURC_03763 [Burkholderiaceae bacterium]